MPEDDFDIYGEEEWKQEVRTNCVYALDILLTLCPDWVDSTASRAGQRTCTIPDDLSRTQRWR